MSFAHPTSVERPATFADLNAVPVVDEPNSATKSLTTKKKGFLKRVPNAVSEYAKNIALDYATVFKELLRDSRQRPLKAVLYGGVLAGIVYSYKTNPDYRHLTTRLVDLRQKMSILPTPIHSARADAHLERLTNLINNNRLDHFNCFLFSVLLQRQHDRKCDLYEAQDKTMRKWWWEEIWSNLVDVGAFNRFWYLEHSFKDYDVREDEHL